SPHHRVSDNWYAFLPSVDQLRSISLSSRSIHHPNQLRIKDFARPTLFRFHGRVLELNHPTTIGLHVCDVSFTVSGRVDDLLPISGELVFPSAVPFRFILPPRIARPMPLV